MADWEEIDVSVVRAPQKLPSEYDEKVTVEKISWERAKHEATLSSLQQENEFRKTYAPRIFWVSIAYMAVVLVMTCLTAVTSSFHLSDTVLVALLTSTTATVIGLFAIVTKHFFPGKK